MIFSPDSPAKASRRDGPRRCGDRVQRVRDRRAPHHEDGPAVSPPSVAPLRWSVEQRLSFVEERPKSFWEALQGSEYGFWANVNPEVPHPRWSQATEKPLGSEERIPTQLYNGYGEFVAGLYENRKAEKLFM